MEKKKNNIKREKDMTVRELADLMLKSFNSAQSHVNERFNTVDNKFEILTKEMNRNFKEVNQEINKINLNLVDVVRKDEFDGLEKRVVRLEEESGVSVK